MGAHLNREPHWSAAYGQVLPFFHGNRFRLFHYITLECAIYAVYMIMWQSYCGSVEEKVSLVIGISTFKTYFLSILKMDAYLSIENPFGLSDPEII